MDDSKEDSMETDSSDSDTDLNVPEIFARKSTDTATSSSSEIKITDDSQRKESRLDSLLSEHLQEKAERARLEKVKEQLLKDLEDDSQEEHQQHSESLASEHEDCLQQLDVKSSEPHIHPGIKLFHEEKYCCLYSSQTSPPFACGFSSSASSIDKILAGTTPETITNLLLSKALVTCVQQISDLNTVMIWLLNMLAVHPSPVTSYSCYMNLIGILHQFKLNALGKSKPAYQSWCPHPLAILRIFVNLGAKPSDLLGEHLNFSQDEIRKSLTIGQDENNDHQETVKGHMSKENVQLVLKVIASALQTKPYISKKNLTHIFFMVAKVQLDQNINRFISLEVQECFGALLQCYSDEDWPPVVPNLCRRLLGVSDHHHNQVHLADLLPGTARGSFLQVRLSYMCLRALLQPGENQPSDDEILNFKLAHVANLSCCTLRPPISDLAKALRALLEHDLYKMISAVKFLDMCVGDDLYRSAQPWQSLEYLIGQMNLVIRTIKDTSRVMDLSKIKDSLSKLKIKWSLSLQDHRSKQRSIFPWLSQTGNNSITQEVLRGHTSLLDDDVE